MTARHKNISHNNHRAPLIFLRTRMIVVGLYREVLSLYDIYWSHPPLTSICHYNKEIKILQEIEYFPSA